MGENKKKTVEHKKEAKESGCTVTLLCLQPFDCLNAAPFLGPHFRWHCSVSVSVLLLLLLLLLDFCTSLQKGLTQFLGPFRSAL